MVSSLMANVSDSSALGGHNIRSHLHHGQTTLQRTCSSTRRAQHYFLPKEILFSFYMVTQIVQFPPKHSFS